MIALVALFLAAPDVRYAVHIESRSWQPLDDKEVTALLENTALPILTRSGLMKLTKSGFADLKKGDYSLLVEGRFIEEAEQFSVYVTFGPGTQNEVPSFYASETDDIGRRPAAAMQKVITTLATKTAQRLIELLEPRLSNAAPGIASGVLPQGFGPVVIPTVAAPTDAIKKLLDVRNEDNVRLTAWTQLKEHTYDQPAVERAMQICMLRDPSPEVRVRCVEALAASSRTRAPVQRLVLAAMRQELEPEVLKALTDLSQNFAGLSRKEAIATSLNLVASEATPGESASAIAGLLAREGDVPNLDLAVSQCLQQQALAYGKKTACADELLRIIPPARRTAVVWKYLEKVAVHEQGEANTYDTVFKSVAGYDSKPLPEALAALFLKVALRPQSGNAKPDALVAAARYPHPPPLVVQQLMSMTTDGHYGWMAVRAVSEMARNSPEQKPLIIKTAQHLIETEPFFHRAHTPDPKEDLEKLIKDLSR